MMPKLETGAGNQEQLPTITVNIETYNNESVIRNCLASIYRQDYPKELLEVLIVDGGSTDRTLDICKEYPARILHNKLRDSASGRKQGLLAAAGELHFYLDADMELKGNDWIRRMIYPLLADKTIVASFTGISVRRTDPPLNRYFCYNEFQLDPMLEFFCPKVEDSILEHHDGYDVAYLAPGRVPFAGMMLFRTETIKGIFAEKDTEWMWIDVDFPIYLTKKGYRRFAWLRDVGFFHYSYLSLRKMVAKKTRDINWSYLPTFGHRDSYYLDFSRRNDVAKLVIWIVYANLMVPEFVRAISRCIRKRDWAPLYGPVVAPIVTDYVTYLVLRSKDGRRIVKRIAMKLLGLR